MERRLDQISKGGAKELIWILEHDEIYTGGTSFKDNEILDKSINFIKTNRGGKITFHGPGQLIFYFIIDLRKRDINIRKLISSIEKTIIDTLSYFKIKSFADRKNIGIWYRNNKNIEKVAAIGIKVKKWIAYHGFSININIDLKKYEKIIPCGIKEKKITNLIKIKKQNYKIIKDMLIKNFLTNIQN
jgi:lipoyl(octanoyl) transferase